MADQEIVASSLLVTVLDRGESGAARKQDLQIEFTSLTISDPPPQPRTDWKLTVPAAVVEQIVRLLNQYPLGLSEDPDFKDVFTENPLIAQIS